MKDCCRRCRHCLQDERQWRKQWRHRRSDSQRDLGFRGNSRAGAAEAGAAGAAAAGARAAQAGEEFRGSSRNFEGWGRWGWLFPRVWVKVWFGYMAMLLLLSLLSLIPSLPGIGGYVVEAAGMGSCKGWFIDLLKVFSM